MKYFVSLETIKMFAEVAGDPNPIHQDEVIAKEMGLEGPIAHGMFVYSYLLRCLDLWLKDFNQTNGTSWNVAETKCRFHQYVLIGDEYETSVEIADQKEDQIKMNLNFTNLKGERLTNVVAVLRKI
jgi:acyl dehydratase